MDESMRMLGYVTFGAMIVTAAAATALFVRELPGIVRYVKIARM